MHNYTMDIGKDIRTKITFIIALISVGILFGLSFILNIFGIESLPLPIDMSNKAIFKLFLGLSKAGAVFGVLYYVFDNWLWKTKCIKKIHKVPDLNGVWNGEFISSFKDELGNNKKGTCKMNIKQTWSKISIVGNFNESLSYSQTATILDNSNGIQLKFEYSNKPYKTVNENLKEHLGHNTLIYNEEQESLNGDYFTNASRQTHGIINVSKEVQSNSEYSNA